MRRERYHINVFYSDEDRCYVADIPDLRFCSAFGDSPDEAVAEVQIAMKGWLGVVRRLKRRIPKARYRPAIYATPR